MKNMDLESRLEGVDDLRQAANVLNSHFFDDAYERTGDFLRIFNTACGLSSKLNPPKELYSHIGGIWALMENETRKKEERELIDIDKVRDAYDRTFNIVHRNIRDTEETQQLPVRAHRKPIPVLSAIQEPVPVYPTSIPVPSMPLAAAMPGGYGR